MNTINRQVMSSTCHGDTTSPLLPLRATMNERITIPIISSIIAAATIVVPTLPESLPSSLSVATVTLTDVAVRITP